MCGDTPRPAVDGNDLSVNSTCNECNCSQIWEQSNHFDAFQTTAEFLLWFNQIFEIFRFYLLVPMDFIIQKSFDSTNNWIQLEILVQSPFELLFFVEEKAFANVDSFSFVLLLLFSSSFLMKHSNDHLFQRIVSSVTNIVHMFSFYTQRKRKN